MAAGTTAGVDNAGVSTEPGPALRLLRAAVLAAVATLLGALAHSQAGGRLPGVVGFVVLLSLLTAATAPLLARPASTRRVVALVAGGQTFVHVVLTGVSGHAGDGVGAARRSVAPVLPPPTTAGTDRVGNLADLLHPQPAPVAGSGPAVPDWVLHLAADLQPAQLPMMLGHLAAAAGVGLWLASGERALFGLLAVLAAPVLRLLVATAPVVAAPVRAPGPALRIPARRREVPLVSSVGRRGPPTPALHPA